MKSLTQKLTVALFAGLIFTQSGFAQDTSSLLQKAEALLAKGQAAEAYQLLAPLEAQQNKDPAYNYLFGASLLESGKPALAIPAFKRVLAANPQFAAARLDLARAQFAVGKLDEAKSTFTTALFQNPPPAAQQVIEYHLAEIDKRRGETYFSSTGYVSAGVGRDSNVSGGIEDGRLFLTDGTPFDLDEKNIKAPDTYLATNAGGNVRLLVNESLALFTNLDVARRDHSKLRGFDNMNASLQGGVEKNFGDSTIKLSAVFGRGILDYANLRRNNGAALEWRYDISRLNQLTWFAQASRLRYAPALYKDFDVDQRQLGFSWFVVSNAANNPALSVSAFVAKDQALGAAIDGSKRTVGARLGGQVGSPIGVLSTSGGYSVDEYSVQRPLLFGTDPGVQATNLNRRDQRLDMNFGLTWNPALNWTIKSNFTRLNASSNIPIYEFSRNDFSLSVRRDFR